MSHAQALHTKGDCCAACISCLQRYDPVTTGIGSLLVTGYCVVAHQQSVWEALNIAACATVLGMVGWTARVAEAASGPCTCLLIWPAAAYACNEHTPVTILLGRQELFRMVLVVLSCCGVWWVSFLHPDYFLRFH
jgi:hypothetical protein